ncbi:hypothetical protein DRW03_21285 [Corallococcus sp. H22C18031201]|nr:hypothetical protein DRW03_21285 [Corallococcus sp. H22C18031201]
MVVVNSIDSVHEAVARDHDTLKAGNATREHSLHCPQCTALRRVRMVALLLRGEPVALKSPATESSIGVTLEPRDIMDDRWEEIEDQKCKDRLEFLGERGLAPSVFMFECVQCDTRFTGLVCAGVSLVDVWVLVPTVMGGVATPHAPPAVRYYLDQAWKCQSVAAYSAAAAMYRAALEQVLESEGYAQSMLAAKIQAFEESVTSPGPSTPGWAKSLDSAFLRVIKDLGNGAIHSNAGDISPQSSFDANLISQVEATFSELMDVVYEAPAKQAERLKKMQAAALVVSRKKAQGG